MNLRFALFVGVLSLTPLACTYQNPSSSETIPDRYPLRDDFLVRVAPKPVPSGWFQPGEPPLLQLRQPPDTWSADTKALATEVQAKNIVEPKKLDEEYRQPLADALTKLFGTPAAPKVVAGSSELTEIVRELQLDPETLAHGAQVYRANCIDCHGLTGNGNGPGGKWLVPLPRDYRQGIFKFISSDDPNSSKDATLRCGPKPRRADLKRTLVQGMNGASMPAFSALPERDIEAVISYVTHLAIRGESEYTTMLSFIREENESDEIEEELATNFQLIAGKWLRAERTPIVVEPDPVTDEETLLASASNGYALFLTSGGCVACHRDYGRNGAFQYDSWGGITRARNLTLGTLRGGSRGDAIYTRLYIGIAGSGMPPHHTSLKSTPEELAAGRNKLWDVAHFVQVLGDPARRQALRSRYGVAIE